MVIEAHSEVSEVRCGGREPMHDYISFIHFEFMKKKIFSTKSLKLMDEISYI